MLVFGLCLCVVSSWGNMYSGVGRTTLAGYKREKLSCSSAIISLTRFPKPSCARRSQMNLLQLQLAGTHVASWESCLGHTLILLDRSVFQQPVERALRCQSADVGRLLTGLSIDLPLDSNCWSVDQCAGRCWSASVKRVSTSLAFEHRCIHSLVLFLHLSQLTVNKRKGPLDKKLDAERYP